MAQMVGWLVLYIHFGLSNLTNLFWLGMRCEGRDFKDLQPVQLALSFLEKPHFMLVLPSYILFDMKTNAW